MHAHYLQHVPFEGLGSIEPWLRKAGYQITKTPLYEWAGLPESIDFDLLVVMGGPMSVNDEADYPWLAPEKQFIRRVIKAGIPVLGICLGAQLIAGSLGARVYGNQEKEIGWFPVTRVSSENDDVFQFPLITEVFHWHGETFELPTGAVHLARSEGCANQAFQIGKTVIGLQFHLEITPDSARELVMQCRGELIPSRYIQTEDDILSVPDEKYRSINQMMSRLLSFLQPNKQDEKEA
jgi:GMP synthase-like glutamine amidotransferase